MKVVIQRVTSSNVKVDGKIVGEINQGLNILLGVLKDDTKEDIQKLINKIINLRIFSDENGKMNKSIQDIDGELLVISQFTLAGNCKKGRRPSFDNSASPDIAKNYYEEFINQAKQYIKNVQSGIFAASMEVNIINDGPVTFILDSKEL